mgnify:CR=1 FL=1
MSVTIQDTITSFSVAVEEAAPQQNLILYSEDLTNVAWVMYSTDFVDVVANQETDLNSQLTLDECTTGSGEGWMYQVVSSNISTNTDYVISFEANSADSWGTTLHVQIENISPNTVHLDTSYGGSLTETVQRLSYEFTTPATINSGIRVHIIAQQSGGSPGVLNIGRIHLYQGNIGDKSYVATTSSQVV